MVIYAEAECETCHAIKPKNEMREVQVKRLAGEFTGSARNSNQSNRRSNSFSKSGARFGSSSTSSSGRKSHSRQYKRVERVWVCDGCPAPKSDGEWSISHYVAVALLVLGFIYWENSRADAPKAAAAASPAVEIAPAETTSPALQEAGTDEYPANETEAAASDVSQAAESNLDGALSPPADTAPSPEPSVSSDEAALQAQLDHTAELRRQGEEEAARIDREAAEQEQRYMEQARRR